VTVYDIAAVRACDNSTVTACDNSTVRACDNSTVRAYGNSTVTACDNSTVTACDNSVTIEAALMLAVIIMIGCVCKIKRKSKTATVIKNKIATHTKQTFKDVYSDNLIDKDTIKLYKSVRPDNHKDFHSNTIEYKLGVVECPDWDPSADIECGNGLHLSPLPELALSYNNGLLLACTAKLKDIAVYPHNITKIRCKKVTVIGEYKKANAK